MWGEREARWRGAYRSAFEHRRNLEDGLLGREIEMEAGLIDYIPRGFGTNNRRVWGSGCWFSCISSREVRCYIG